MDSASGSGARAAWESTRSPRATPSSSSSLSRPSHSFRFCWLSCRSSASSASPAGVQPSSARRRSAGVFGALDQAAAHQVVGQQTGRRLTDRELAAEFADGDAATVIDDHQGAELRHSEVEPQPGRHLELLQVRIDGSHVADDLVDERASGVHSRPFRWGCLPGSRDIRASGRRRRLRELTKCSRYTISVNLIGNCERDAGDGVGRAPSGAGDHRLAGLLTGRLRTTDIDTGGGTGTDMERHLSSGRG